MSKAIDKLNGRRFEDRYALGRHIRERREAVGLSRAEVNAWFGYRDGCEHWERQDPSGARVPTVADWTVLRERLGLSDEWLSLIERVEAEREVIGRTTSGAGNGSVVGLGSVRSMDTEYDVTAPATPAAVEWSGWNTSLKPAYEPIILARKPFRGTVAANVLAHGTGAIHVDACRTAHAGAADLAESQGKNPGRDDTTASDVYGASRPQQRVSTDGRWPTNLLLSHLPECGDECAPGCVARALDAQSGILTSGQLKAGHKQGQGMTYVGKPTNRIQKDYGGDSGGASRFYPTFRYQPKAPASERPMIDGRGWPTVKPQGLMRWLCRLLCPPGGVVLDPFAGTAATAQAAETEGFSAIAIERDPFAWSLARQRLATPVQQSIPDPPPALFELDREAM